MTTSKDVPKSSVSSGRTFLHKYYHLKGNGDWTWEFLYRKNYGGIIENRSFNVPYKTLKESGKIVVLKIIGMYKCNINQQGL